MTQETQKQLAIGHHSHLAEQFTDRYRRLRGNQYNSCFAYSRHRLGGWLDRFLSGCPAGARLLDVGCGTGHHMAELRERGFDVVGVDGSEDMLRQARALNPSSEIYCADVERLPFPDAFFDFVLCIEVLRYLPQSSECLREMARVLKPGGMCLFTALPLLNLNGYWLVNRLAGLLRPRNLVHLRQFFTISSQIRRQCLEARLLSPLVVGVYFGPVNWVERLAPVFLPRFLKSWERLDTILADRPALREFSNMFLVRAVREGQGHDSE